MSPEIVTESCAQLLTFVAKANEHSAGGISWQELIKILPQMGWLVFWVVMILLFYKQIRDELLPRLTGMSFLGAEVLFVREFIDAAVELAEKSPQWQVTVPAVARQQATKRARQHLSQMAGGQILWVDDHPENNINERRMFRQLKMDVDSAKTTDEALSMLAHGNYDLVISDMARGQENLAGLDFLGRYRESFNGRASPPVIFYIGVADPSKGVPGYAFGLTYRPDELLHLVIDVMDRHSK